MKVSSVRHLYPRSSGAYLRVALIRFFLQEVPCRHSTEALFEAREWRSCSGERLLLVLVPVHYAFLRLSQALQYPPFRSALLVLAGMLLGVELMSVVGNRSVFSHSVAKAAPSLGAADAGDAQLIVIPEVQREPRTRFLSAFQLPEHLTFAGQSVPLDNWQVRERIEYEFYQFLADEGQSVILAKRSGRCFPQFELQLAAAGLPDDLKYLLLLDNKCPNTVSVPYQPGTSRRRPIRTSSFPLNRRQLELSVETTMARLTAVKAKTDDWFLATAAYIGGEDHLQRGLTEQKVREYWKLSDSREIMRYVPRLIAAKEIYSHPDRYLGLAKKDLYAPVETEAVIVHVTEPKRHLAAIANDLGTYYLELKLLNPHITHDSLPRGTHTLKVAKQRTVVP